MDTIYNRDGCFYRALDDEPVFVLLARDPCTPEAIRWWVTLRQALIGRGEKPMEDHAMLADAIQTAEAAVVWRSDATDPTVWGQSPRWKTEKVPERKLVARDRVEAEEARFDEQAREMNGMVERIEMLEKRTLANANRFYGYAANHFAKDTEDAWRKGEVNWTEYLANIELLGLNPADKPTGGSKAAHDHFAAEETISEAQRHTVSTIKGLLGESMDLTTLVDLPPAEGRPDAILRKRLEPFDDDARITLSAKALRKVLAATPFVAVDLARKIATGLRQLTDEYVVVVNSTTWPNTRKNNMLAYADRLNGYAAELEAGAIVGDSLRSRTVGKSPLLGEPYMPSPVHDMGAPHDTPLLVKVTSNFKIDHESSAVFKNGAWYFITAMGKDGTPETLESMRGNPKAWRERPQHEWNYGPDIYADLAETMTRAPTFSNDLPWDPARYRKGHETVKPLEMKVEYDPQTESPAAILKAIADNFGISYEDMARDYRRVNGITEPAESDTTDVTAVPDLKPHRFAMFDKGREWAYGRGLEIAPTHIPAMLDRMEADGWHLVSAIGAKASEVGMLFYRREPSAFERAHGYGETFEPAPKRDDKPTEWPQQRFLGTYEGFGVWIDLKAPDHVQRCVRSLLGTPCGPDGLGRGVEP